MWFVVFWGGLWAICIVAIVMPVLQQRELQKTLRQIISKGEALDPLTVEALMGRKKPVLRQDQQFMVAGISLAALGLGVLPLSWLIGHGSREVSYPILGGGIVLCLLSVAMLLIWRVLDLERTRGAAEDA